MKLNERLNYYINNLHQLIFHVPISEEVKKIIQIISVFSLGSVLSFIFILPYNILSIRFLGPEEYGKFILVQSISMFIYIPMMFGYGTALIKYTSESKNADDRTEIISTAGITITALTIFSSFVFVIFTDFFSNLLLIPPDLFYLSIILAIFYVLYILSSSMLKGLFNIKFLSYLQPIYSLSILSFFLMGVYFFTQSFFAVFIATIVAYGFISLIILFTIRQHIHIIFNILIFRKMSVYAMYATIGGISFALYNNIDKLLINSTLSTNDVGIYAAYYLASFTAPGFLASILNTIFFPYASKEKNEREIVKRLDKLLPYFILFGGGLSCIVTVIFLKLFGTAYPIDLVLILLFALAAVLLLYCGLYEWVINSVGIRGIKFTCGIDVTIAITNIISNIVLTPKYGLYGAISSTIIAFAVGLCLIFLKKDLVII